MTTKSAIPTWETLPSDLAERLQKREPETLQAFLKYMEGREGDQIPANVTVEKLEGSPRGKKYILSGEKNDIKISNSPQATVVDFGIGNSWSTWHKRAVPVESVPLKSTHAPQVDTSLKVSTP